MEKIGRDKVRHVAHLARLSLDEAELTIYSRQLESILSYISKLNQLNTEGVQPTSHPLTTMKNVFRKDAVKPSLKPEEALENAPEIDGRFFKVPQVVEGK